MGRLSSTKSGGRYKSRASGGDFDFGSAEGLAEYARTVGLESDVSKILGDTDKPKLGALQRLSKTLGAFNPAEAILTGIEKGAGAGVGKYISGIGKGLASGLTGKDYEGERRYFKEVAGALGIENGIAKSGIGFVGDVLLDPTTYFGGAIARGLGLGVKGAGKAVTKGITKISPESAAGLATAKEGLSDAFGNLFRAGYKTQEGFVGDTMRLLGRTNKAAKGLAESNLARLGTGILTPEQNAEVFTRLSGGKRLEFLLRSGEVPQNIKYTTSDAFRGMKMELDDILLQKELNPTNITKSVLKREKELQKALVKESGEVAQRAVLKGATGAVKETLEQQMARGAKFGQELVGDEFYRSYFPFLKKEKVSKFLTETQPLRIGSESYKKQFKNLLTDENLEQDVAKAFFNRETQVVSDRLTKDFLKNVAVGKYGKPLKAFKSEQEALQAGYRLLREKGIHGKELGYIPKWDYKFLQDMFSPEFKSIDMIAKATGFDAITSLFKRSVTGMFPAFHIRNYVSGMIQNYEVLGLTALDPKIIASGQKLALNAIRGTKMTGKYADTLKPFTERFAFSSFYKNEFDNALNAGQTLEQYQKIFSKGTLKSTVKSAGLSTDSAHFRVAREVGNYIEMQQKATAYIAALTQGKTVKEALLLAEKAGFDYKMLTKFESQILRRIVPFYSFTRKNIELQLKTLGENPQRINQIIRSIENIGAEVSPEEKQGLPEYLKQSLGISLGKDAESGLTRYVSSFGTPIEAFTQLFKPNTVLTVISQTNPLIKAPIELGIGKDSFRQRDLKDVYDAKEYSDVPQVIKDLLDIKEVERFRYEKRNGKLVPVESYIQYVADPEKLLIARSLFTSRGITFFDNVFDKDISKMAKFINLFTGIKAQEINPEVTAALKEKDNKRALEDILIRLGELREFRSLYKPKQ